VRTFANSSTEIRSNIGALFSYSSARVTNDISNYWSHQPSQLPPAPRGINLPRPASRPSPTVQHNASPAWNATPACGRAIIKYFSIRPEEIQELHVRSIHTPSQRSCHQPRSIMKSARTAHAMESHNPLPEFRFAPLSPRNESS